MHSTKKIPLQITAVLLMMLGLCTLLSHWVEEVMIPEVHAQVPRINEDELYVLPVTALTDPVAADTVVQLLPPDKGGSQTKKQASFQPVSVVELGEDGTFTTTSLSATPYVNASSRPLIHGETVEVLKGEPAPLRESVPLVVALLLQLLLSLCLMVPVIRRVGALVEARGSHLKNVAIVLCLLLIMFVGLAVVLHFADIPNRYLPPKNILDISFYLQNWGQGTFG